MYLIINILFRKMAPSIFSIVKREATPEVAGGEPPILEPTEKSPVEAVVASTLETRIFNHKPRISTTVTPDGKC